MKKLSLAIYWHFHQPCYKIEGTYLMPWTRLHAVKDYLDMVLFLEKFPNLKLNIDIVPTLIDSLTEYSGGAQDIHSELSVINVDTMTDEEKSFVLNNFFSLKYDTMICRSEHYKALHKKRFGQHSFDITDFSNQEISDLMALFNLAWIDSVHYQKHPRLQELWNKQYDYTLEDRIEIVNIHYQIIKEIIPTYKKYVNDGRLEITTSPYFHPILPILLDAKNAIKSGNTIEGLPEKFKMHGDAVIQVKGAISKIEEVFGVKPKGMWSPELCIDSKTLDLLAKEGIEWTISDERILSDSIDFDFVRDFRGNLNDPYRLLKVYEYKSKSNPIDIIFRDRSIPALINFEYCGVDTKMAVNDLTDKIKSIQNKILASPDETHVLTIALDGENCWENYQNDGNDFLSNLYEMIENDNTLETVLISDYIKKDKYKKTLNKINSGSWIDKTFRYWIGEATKNKAWALLKRTKDDYNNIAKQECKNPNLVSALKEMLIAEGSDWFWWYGEPNNSGQDFVFDYIFRERLKNVYYLLGHEPPEELNESLIKKIELPLKYPTNNISPRIDGLLSSSDDWYCSGNINLVDGPVFMENKSVDKIQYGCDSNNIYFRLHVTKGNDSNSGFPERINQFFIYMRNATTIKERAYIRLIGKTDTQIPVFQEKFENELTLTLVQDVLYPPRLSTCLHQNMWTLASPIGVNIVYNDVIDVSIPFNTLSIKNGETVEFFMSNTDSGIKNTYNSQEILFNLTRI